MKELLTEHQETMQAIYSQEILSVKEEWDMPHTNTEGMNRVRCEALFLGARLIVPSFF